MMGERVRPIVRETLAAVQSRALGHLVDQARATLAGRVYLRRCTRVGPLARVYGRPRIVNGGTLIIGERARIWSTTARTEFAVFSGGVLEIGDNVSINYGTSIAATGLVRIGHNCMLGTHSMILDNDFHELENRNKIPSPRAVILEDNVWLGNRTLIMPGVTIGHDSVVGAGSVVLTSVPPRSLALGNPARVMKTF